MSEGRLRYSPVRRRSGLLFDWDGVNGWNANGEPVTVDGVVGTYTQAGICYALGSDGYYAPHAPGVRRLGYTYNADSGLWERAGTLVEGVRTNYLKRTHDLDHADWTIDDFSAGQTELVGQSVVRGQSAWRVTNPGGGSRAMGQDLGTPGAVNRVVWAELENPTTNGADVTTLGLYDATTPGWSNGIAVEFDWDTGIASVFNGSGHVGALQIGPRRWLIWCSRAMVAAKAYNALFYWTGTATNGAAMIVHACGVENGLTPTSPIVTAGASVTRGADALTFPVAFLTQSLTVYADMTDHGATRNESGTWELGQFGTYPALACYRPSGTTGALAINYNDGQGQVGTSGVTAAAFGERGEELAQVRADGSLYYAHSVAGGAALTATSSTMSIPTLEWGNDLVRLGYYTGGGQHGVVVHRFRIAPGERTLDEMRAL